MADRGPSNLNNVLFHTQAVTFEQVDKKRPWPEGRECHAACVLGQNTDHPQLLVSGGKNTYDHALKFDMWMLDVAALIWKKAG